VIESQAREIWAHRNVKAFARVVREHESSQDDEIAYRMRFPNKTFDDFSKHPNIREPISWKPGEFSTAAGAYQITGTTDRGLRRAYPFLSARFDPEWQDLRFVCLLEDCGALPYVLAGKFEEAIYECVKGPIIWTSLPGGPENPQEMAKARAVYEKYGGTYATQPAAPIEDKSPTLPEETKMPEIPGTVIGLATAVNPVAGLVLGLANTVIQTFSGLAQEKLAKEIGRHTDKPEVAQQMSADIMDNARAALGQVLGPQAVQGKSDIQVAAIYQEQAIKNPAVAKMVEDTTLKDLNDMMPTLKFLDEMDAKKLADEDASRDKALTRGLSIQEAGPLWQNPTFLIAGVVLVLVGYVVFRVLDKLPPDQGGFSTDMKALVIGTIMGTALVAVLNFFFGSSRSSNQKDQIISEQLNKQKPR
jgi:muramidase (phage lysozyme)